MSSQSEINVPTSVSQETKPELDPQQAHPIITETIRSASPTSQPSQDALPNHPQTSSSPSHPQTAARTSFERLILASAAHDTPTTLDPATATPAQAAAERARRLAARTTQHRFIFNEWPRDPRGKPLRRDTASERSGKQTSNGVEIWGATLFDLYTVRRFPEMQNGVTFSSGSRLAAWMRLHGEGYAVDALRAADEEEAPRLVWPYAIAGLIKEGERRPGVVKSWARWHEKRDDADGDARMRQEWELPDNWPPESIFSPQAYPSPWPDAPFSTDPHLKPPTLQSYMTQSQLPQKLIVHDPDNLLNAKGHNHHPPSRPSTPTHTTHVYTLTASATHTARATSDAAQLAASDATRRQTRAAFLAAPSSAAPHPSGMLVARRSTPGPCAPPIFVVFPHLPERGRIPEAHLHLSGTAPLGTGGHSYVYRAELALPRAFLVDEAMCRHCVLEDLEKILDEEDGPDGARRDPKWEQLSGRYEYKVVKKTSGAHASFKDDDGVEREYLVLPPEEHVVLMYTGPYRAIETRVPYQDLASAPYCKHLEKDNIHPLTSKVSVAAKLSIRGDGHLAREAENYQAFPRHFFEHWNGYNIVPPINHPVPVTPVVPQYYGYYVVDKSASASSRTNEKNETTGNEAEKNVESAGQEKSQDENSKETNETEESSDMDIENVEKEAAEEDESESNEETEDEEDDEDEDDRYLSPILLLEDCGTSIDPNALSVDDQYECAALVYKFHHAKWFHGSVARRNIVRQPGPLNASPAERMVNTTKRNGLGTDWSYRLIDFGRSRRYEDLSAEGGSSLREEQFMLFKWLEDFGELD